MHSNNQLGASAMEAAPMEAAHCIRANTHWQQTSCMCGTSCGVCLSLSLWVGVNVYISSVCVCLDIGITSCMYHFHAVCSIAVDCMQVSG